MGEVRSVPSTREIIAMTLATQFFDAPPCLGTCAALHKMGYRGTANGNSMPRNMNLFMLFLATTGNSACSATANE